MPSVSRRPNPPWSQAAGSRLAGIGPLDTGYLGSIGLGPQALEPPRELGAPGAFDRWAPLIPRDQGADEAGSWVPTPSIEQADDGRRSAKFPCDPGAATGCMTMADGNQGTKMHLDDPGASSALAPTSPGRLKLAAHSTCWPPIRHDSGCCWCHDNLVYWYGGPPAACKSALPPRRPDADSAGPPGNGSRAGQGGAGRRRSIRAGAPLPGDESPPSRAPRSPRPGLRSRRATPWQ